MSYIDQRIPPRVAFGFTGGPEWATLIVPLDNGREQRNAQWLYPRHRYSCEYLNLLPEARDFLLNLFHAARGRLHCFRMRDHMDHRASAAPLAPGIGTSAPVQLFKTYSYGGQTTSRIIQAPLPGAVVRRNGVPVPGTLDTQLGLFTPSAPWVAGVYTWDGEFDVWVRFDSDYNAFSVTAPDGHTVSVDLVEVRR